MKRVGGIYDRIWQWDNLRLAFYRARRGSGRSPEVLRFEQQLAGNLSRMREELRAGCVIFEGFRQFRIHDPKERTITAPAFRDRVLHHAIMGVCEAYFDRWQLADSFACRRGKGRLAALRWATNHARRYEWFLKLDIRKYFESVSHEVLQSALEKKFKDRRVLDLLRSITAAHEAGSGVGLPIGSLVSQHLANFYLVTLDRFVQETLRAPGYVRYMDDFVLWSSRREDLRLWWRRIEEFLHGQLRLELKAGSHINRTEHGMDFCGFRIFRGWRGLNRGSRKRLLARLRELRELEGHVSERVFQARAEALFAFAKEGQTIEDRRWALARAFTG